MNSQPIRTHFCQQTDMFLHFTCWLERTNNQSHNSSFLNVINPCFHCVVQLSSAHFWYQVLFSVWFPTAGRHTLFKKRLKAARQKCMGNPTSERRWQDDWLLCVTLMTILSDQWWGSELSHTMHWKQAIRRQQQEFNYKIMANATVKWQAPQRFLLA